MLRRCRPLSVTGLAALAPAALLALFPLPSDAQTPSADRSVDLLAPTLQGNPNNPPTFVLPGNSTTPPPDQAPPPGKFTAPSRIGATPVYGSPTGFGAGDTGFDSSNRAKRQRTAKVPDPGSSIAQSEPTFDPVAPLPPQISSRPPVLAPPPAPVVYPAKAAARPGAILPPPPDQLPISNPPAEVHPVSAANRAGAVLPIPPPIDFVGSASTPPPGTPQPNILPLGTVPQHTLPIASGDPYQALGIKIGSFLMLPAVELSTGYDGNPQHASTGGPGSVYFVVAPELHVRSDWSSNSLTADVVGSYTDYENDTFSPSLNHPYLNAKVDGRLDVTRDTQILLENRVIVATDNPGNPNIQAGLAKLPIDTTVGGTLGVAEQFARLNVSLKGTVDRSVYQNSDLTDGESVSNDARNFDQYAGILRLRYEVTPGFKPFVEVSEDTRIHDLQFDSFGEDRDSNGQSAKVGGDVDLFGSLTGEMAVGYMERDYHDPTLPNISGTTLDGSLLWQVTGLTTAKFTAASTVSESILQGVSGAFSRDFNIEVDHALRTWLIANVQVGYGRDEYAGLARDDNRFFAATGLTYKLNREMQLKGELRHDWLTSTLSGVAYDSTSVLFTLRLQR
ncbi:MAG: outer membrane beta-barrel protein [Xanthobacteraceae bacterium]